MLTAHEANVRAAANCGLHERVGTEVERLAPLVEQASLAGQFQVKYYPKRDHHFRNPSEVRFSQALCKWLENYGYTIAVSPEFSETMLLDWNGK